MNKKKTTRKSANVSNIRVKSVTISRGKMQNNTKSQDQGNETVGTSFKSSENTKKTKTDLADDII